MLGRLIQEQNSSKLLTESFNTYACTGEEMCSRLFGLLGYKSQQYRLPSDKGTWGRFLFLAWILLPRFEWQ